MQSTTTPTDHPEDMQIEIALDGQLALASYTIDAGAMTFTHTFVPESLRGRGLAGQLVKAGLDTARAKGLKVVPHCPVFVDYMKRHPETQELLATPLA